MSLFGKKNNRANNIQREMIDEELVNLLSITINKIGPRYVGEIGVFVGNYYTKIDFEDYNDSYSDIFRAVITKTSASAVWNYEWCLNYHGLTEEEASILRHLGHAEGRCWQIASNREVNAATIAKIASVIQNHSSQVEVMDLGSDNTRICIRCKPA